MWSAIDQPITRREQMSMTVARYSQEEPTATYVMSPSALGVQHVRREAAHHQVGHGRGRLVLDRRALLAPQTTADDVVDPHQPAHALAIDFSPAGAEFGMDARGTIGALLVGVDLSDLRHRPLFLD